MNNAFEHHANLRRISSAVKSIGGSRQGLTLMEHSDTTMGVLINNGTGNYAPPQGYMHYIKLAMQQLEKEILGRARHELEADIAQAAKLAREEMNQE
jgi:hypothetical protein